MAKNIGGILEKLFEYYFLSIFVNVNFLSNFKSNPKYCYN